MVGNSRRFAGLSEASFFMNKTLSTPSFWGATAWLFVALFSACQKAPTRTAADPLQGYWENEDTSVSISGNSLYFYEREDFWFRTEFTLPPGTDPKQLHATILEDNTGDERDIGTVIVAIFKIEDGTLTLVAYTEDATPGSFDDLSDDVHGIYELERAQPRAGRTQPPTNK